MNRKELILAIERVKPTKTTSMEEYSELLFFNKKEICSYNDEVLIKIPFETKIEGAFPAKQLLELLQKIEDEEVKIKQADSAIHISGRITKAKIKQFEIKAPFNKIEIPTKWGKLPEDFIEGLKLCVFSVSQEQGNVLNNIYLEEDKMTSCDNYRVTTYNMKDKMKPCFIPKNIISSLTSFAPTHFQIDKNWLFFKNKQSMFCAKKTMGKYPDTSDILKMKNAKKVTFPDQLKSSLQRTKILADEDITTGNKTIELTLEKGKLHCHGECDIGMIDEHLKIDYDGKRIHFDIIPEFLFDILDKTQTVLIGESSLKFKTKNFQHVISIIK